MTATTQQAMQALGLANDVRISNAEFKRTVALMPSEEGSELVASAIEDLHDDEAIGAMPIDRLLMCVRQFGESRTVRCLAVASVANPRKRLRDLTVRQRYAVAAQLRLWGLGYRG